MGWPRLLRGITEGEIRAGSDRGLTHLRLRDRLRGVGSIARRLGRVGGSRLLHGTTETEVWPGEE